MLAAGLAAAPAAAWAHPVGAHAAEAAGAWWSSIDPGPLVGTLALAALYAAGVQRLWARAGHGRGVRVAQARAFAAAAVVLLVALASPLDAVADALFSAHMVQHLLLILAAAPLLALANVPLALAWALPLGARRALAAWWNAPRPAARARRGAAHVLAAPAAAWLLHAVALVAWHVPVLYQAALERPAVHALEHLSFLGTGWLFWWRVAQPLGRRALGVPAAIPYVMSMGVLGSAMGALLAFSGTPWYPGHGAGARLWHTTLLADQQLAGLIMWVPAGVVYLGASLAVAARWMLADARRAGRRARRGVSAAAAGAAAAAVLAGCAHQTPPDARDEGVQPVAIAGVGQPHGEAADVGPHSRAAEHGVQLIRSYGCGSCHSIPGVTGADGMVGPPLVAWGRRTMVAGYLPNTPEQLEHWLVAPQSVAPGNAMPNLGVTQAEARDIAAYLYTLR